MPSLLTADPQNANVGTARGQALLRESLETCGAGRSILVDKHGTIIGGNKTHAAAQALGLETQIVETDGHELVVVQRTDLDLATDPTARQLAYYDNRVHELDVAWSPAQLQVDLTAGIAIGDVFFPHELQALALDPSVVPVLPVLPVLFDPPEPLPPEPVPEPPEPDEPLPRVVVTFATIDQQLLWKRFMKALRERYPDLPTGRARLAAYLTSLGIE